MANVTYSATSAYYETKVENGALGMLVNRRFPKLAEDRVFIINQTYDLRPDLLAYDLYDKSDLWWVFAQRNPNTLKDPLYDFRVGTQIYLPQLATLKEALGF